MCEVSVDQDHVIKQKRLPDQINNLAEKLALDARYYLKCNTQFWVINEISLFAILSGLEHLTVTRLKGPWDKTNSQKNKPVLWYN